VTFRGIAAWIRVGDVFIQPVEIAKLALVILLAKFFSKRHIEIYRVRHLIISGVYVLIPTALVILQPDLGSAIIITAIWLGMVLLAGISWKHLAALLNSHQALLDAATGEWTSWADNLPALLSYVADMLEGEAQKQNATNYIAPHLRKASKGLRDAIDAAKE